MGKEHRIRATLLFCAGLMAAMPLFLVLWGYLLPAYGALLGHVTGALISVFQGTTVADVVVEPHGLFNTQTVLAFVIPGHTPRLNIGALVFNIPPFLALMLLSPGLPLRRRFWSTVVGVVILCVGHTLYIALAFRYASAIAKAPEIPTALGELFLTLPFLLWIILGYGDRLGRRAGDAEKPSQAEPEITRES